MIPVYVVVVVVVVVVATFGRLLQTSSWVGLVVRLGKGVCWWADGLVEPAVEILFTFKSP